MDVHSLAARVHHEYQPGAVLQPRPDLIHDICIQLARGNDLDGEVRGTGNVAVVPLKGWNPGSGQKPDIRRPHRIRVRRKLIPDPSERHAEPPILSISPQ